MTKGYTHKEGIDYEDFSLVVRFASVCVLLATLAHWDIELFQMDVNTTFPNGEVRDLYEKTYYFKV